MNPFTDQPLRAVAALGERRLIARLRDWLGAANPPAPFGIGDDCAVLHPRAGRVQLVTTDPVLFGRHFDATVPAAGVAEKLLKRNLSDIAAMGGVPRAAVVSLSLPRRTSLAWLETFYRALGRCALAHRVVIAGGDVAESDTLGAALTLLGESAGPRTRVLTRRGARPGDWIYVTGELGGSILGKHFRFAPRLAEGRWLAARPEVRSLMDVSDGLAKDLLELAPAGTRPLLDPDAVPVSAAARKLAARDGRPPLAHALGDGEDFELVFTVAARADRAKFTAAWRRKFPALPLSCLGLFVEAALPRPVGALRLEDFHGYEHLG